MSIFDDIADVVEDVAEGIVDAAEGLVAAAADLFDGPGGFVGVLVGAGGALFLQSVTGAIVPAFIASEAANRLIRYRSLSPEESQFAWPVFRDTLPTPERIILTNLAGEGNRAFTVPNPSGEFIINLGHNFDNPLQNKALLVHELTHVWQIHYATFTPGLICEAISNQVQFILGDKGIYEPGTEEHQWSTFNLEQQATIVERWYVDKMRDDHPFFRYIKGNIWARSPSAYTAPLASQQAANYVVARTATHLDLFWCGADGNIGTTWWDSDANEGKWNTPFAIAHPNAAVPRIVKAVARTPNHLDVFWIAPDGAVVSNWWDAALNNGQWNNPFVVAPAQSASPGAVTAVARTPDHLDVFWIAPDGTVGSTWWNAAVNNGQWNTPFAISPPQSARPGAVTSVARASDHLDVFWIGTDGAVGSNWWDAALNDGRWNTPFAISPPQSAQPGAIAVVARTPDHLDVFWVGADGAIGTNWWNVHVNNAQWNTPYAVTESNMARKGAITAVARSSMQLDIFWIGHDGAVWSAWWHALMNEGKWSKPFIIAPAGSAHPLSAISAIACQSDHLDVFWSGQDGAVISTWWHEGDRWHEPFPVSAAGAAYVSSAGGTT
ncbi:MAG: hypothetical protein KC441_06885 [Anaerolineales bacterium]|nr:hypothetical protein [Anaerolineales bacterium]